MVEDGPKRGWIAAGTEGFLRLLCCSRSGGNGRCWSCGVVKEVLCTLLIDIMGLQGSMIDVIPFFAA